MLSGTRTLAFIPDSGMGIQRGKQSQQGGLQNRGQQRSPPRAGSLQQMPLNRRQQGNDTVPASGEGKRRAIALQGEGTARSQPSTGSSNISGSGTHGAVVYKFSCQAALVLTSVGGKPGPTAESSSGGSGEEAAEALKNSPGIDTLAALFASVGTSVLEGPVEVFRHRLQAGPCTPLACRWPDWAPCLRSTADCLLCLPALPVELRRLRRMLE